MIVLKHTDGRVVVLAHERGIGARARTADGVWYRVEGKRDMSVADLEGFEAVKDERTKEHFFHLARLLTPLSKEEYDAAPVPTREQFREALRKGARELREAVTVRGFTATPVTKEQAAEAWKKVREDWDLSQRNRRKPPGRF